MSGDWLDDIAAREADGCAMIGAYREDVCDLVDEVKRLREKLFQAESARDQYSTDLAMSLAVIAQVERLRDHWRDLDDLPRPVFDALADALTAALKGSK